MYDSESSSDGGWISWFCDLEGHEYFVEVNQHPFLTNVCPIGRHGLHQGQLQPLWSEGENPQI
jgi:hypothetical protein